MRNLAVKSALLRQLWFVVITVLSRCPVSLDLLGSIAFDRVAVRGAPPVGAAQLSPGWLGPR